MTCLWVPRQRGAAEGGGHWNQTGLGLLALSGAPRTNCTPAQCAPQGEQEGEDQHRDAGVSLWSVLSVRGEGGWHWPCRARMLSTLPPEAGTEASDWLPLAGLHQPQTMWKTLQEETVPNEGVKIRDEDSDFHRVPLPPPWQTWAQGRGQGESPEAMGVACSWHVRSPYTHTHTPTSTAHSYLHTHTHAFCPWGIYPPWLLRAHTWLFKSHL